MRSVELNPFHSNFDYHDSVPRVDFHTSRLHDFFRQHRSQTWHDHREKDVADAGVEDAFRGTACNKNIEKEWKRYQKVGEKGKIATCNYSKILAVLMKQFSANLLAKTPWCFTITGIAKRILRDQEEIRRSNAASVQWWTKLHGLGTITIAICLIWCFSLIGVGSLI